jgi:hypothetical protein
MLKVLIGAAAALALLAATPASACKDCGECSHHQSAAAKAQPTGAVAEADKKDKKGCGCDHTSAKDCKCGEKCHCPDCPVHGKEAPKKEDKKS